jgi:hypothetical protein
MPASTGIIVRLAAGSTGTSVNAGGSVPAGGWLGATGDSVSVDDNLPILHAPRINNATTDNTIKTCTLLMTFLLNTGKGGGYHLLDIKVTVYQLYD